MIIRKIAKFEKLEDSYRVWYGDIVLGHRVILSKVEFDLAQCIDEFLRRAIDPKDIERIVELAQQSAVDDTLYQSN
jgi:hypothetical protein